MMGDELKKGQRRVSDGPPTVSPRLPGRVRLHTLIIIRWLAIAGQALALMFVRFGLEFDLPFVEALVPVGASAILNAVLLLRYPASTRLSDRQAAYYLAYDIIQLAALLYLTGGLNNPFAVLMLVPVTISATILSLTSTIWLGALALGCVSVLTFVHLPLPWRAGGLDLPIVFVIGNWVALVLGMAFMGAYAWRVAEEARRMSDALSAAQAALAREQRLSALDGLAAAAAHELGTPLGTIILTAKELEREIPADEPLAEEVRLLIAQAERCRDILSRLRQQPDEDQRGFAVTTFAGLVRAAAEPYMHETANVRLTIAEGHTKGRPPRVGRSPEILQALGNLIENAVDFAREEVRLVIRWDDSEIGVEIHDDGPGIPFDVMGALGDPYVTTRSGEGGMGLGVFIAKTLLERTGALVRFRNRTAPGGGAVGAAVVIIWPRGVLEWHEGIDSEA